MPKSLEINAGQQFTWLTVVSEAGKKRYSNGAISRRFNVRCKCGSEKVVSLGELRSGGAKSCGCWKDMNTVARSTKHGLCPRSGEHPLYRTWQAMKNRCYRVGYVGYQSYGGRGITVCDEWRNDFGRFVSDMGNRPSGMSIDRIDNGKGYSKENCRWATGVEQASNKRNNVLITLNGATHTIAEWGRITGITSNTLHTRYKAGKKPEEILAPVHRRQITQVGKE